MFAVGLNYHAFSHFLGACGDWSTSSFDLHETQSAARLWIDVSHGTQVGYIDTCIQGSKEDSLARFRSDGLAIDGQIYGFFIH